jgi:outer membrane protein TolC
MPFDSICVRRTVAALAVGTAALHAAHAEEPLSLAQALRLAQDRSRQLPAHDAATAAAREMALAAAQRSDPVLKAGVNNLPLDGPDRFSLSRDFMTMRSVGVMQELTRSDKRRSRAARFEREADASEAGRTLALATLQRDTAVAWLDRYYQERMREVWLRQRDEARLQIEAADAAYRGGRGSQADVFAARSSVAQIEDRLAQTERQIATATTQLARWIGTPASGPLGAPAAMETVPLRPQELDKVLEHHPQITLMAKQEDVARAEADIARADRKPDWTVELMYSQRGPAYSNMASINVSVPLPWDRQNRQDRELAAKLAMAERIRAEREEATRAHVAEALAMLQEWQSNRERLGRYDASLIPLAAERTQAAVAAYRGAAGPLNAVLDARRGEIDMRMERLRLEMDTARLWAQLNFLIPNTHELGKNK